MADQDDRHSEKITQLLRHVTSSLHGADVEGGNFTFTISPPSLVVIAFIFSELRREVGIPPPPHRVVENQKMPDQIRVIFSLFQGAL